MEPISLFIILTSQPLVQTTATMVKDFLVSGVLPSYISNYIPVIHTFQQRQDVENVLNKTYSLAVKEWCNNEGAERAALSKRFESINQLQEYIKEDSIESNTVIKELTKLWYNHLEEEELGRWFIEKIQLKNIKTIDKEIRDKVTSLEQKITGIQSAVCDFKIGGQTKFEEDHEYFSRICYTRDECFSRLSGSQGDSLENIVISSILGKHIVLLSSPLMGKTTELKYLCWKLSTNKHYRPVLFELKNTAGILKKELLPQLEYIENYCCPVNFRNSKSVSSKNREG